MTRALTERYADRIGGVLSCYDRLVMTGTLPTVCYAEGMTRYLNARGVRIFDYPQFAKTLCDRVRETAASVAAEAGVKIEPVAKAHVRKEDIIARVLAQRGDAAGFLGRQITPLLAQEIGSQFATRIEGTCIKHRFGSCSIKMYDKHGIVLRIETTANDVSFFKHHRKVEHRQGPPTRELAPVKKTIYSLIDLREILLACNRRYLAHLSALDDFSAGVRSLGRLTKPREIEGRTVKGLNFFAPDEQALLHAIQDPKGSIAGFRRGDLLAELTMLSPTQLSRRLRRLLDIGVVKRVRGTYRYYMTKAGRAATAAAERLTEGIIIPALI